MFLKRLIVPILFLSCLSWINLVSGIEKNKQYWAEHPLLNYTDFKMVNAAPDGSEYKALSQLGISYAFSQNEKGITCTVQSFFNKDESWMLKDSKSDSILLHEQIHYAICELHARALRKSITAYKLNLKTIKVDMEKLYKVEVALYRKEQQLYDAETNHSIKRAKQHQWEAKIQNRLQATEAFAATTILKK
jgi:hypothetical protein